MNSQADEDNDRADRIGTIFLTRRYSFRTNRSDVAMGGMNNGRNGLDNYKEQPRAKRDDGTP